MTSWMAVIKRINGHCNCRKASNGKLSIEKKQTFDWKVKGTRLLKTQLAIFVDSMKKLEGS